MSAARDRTMRITLRVWRQPDSEDAGRFETYHVHDVSPDMSFLEMLDVLNDRLLRSGDDPIAFESDCREGICGTCGFMVDGYAHGPDPGTTVCQLHMRRFADGDVIRIEPWRANAFPVVKDLVVDRAAFDRIIASGGFVSVHTGSAPDGNAIPVAKDVQEEAMDAAACIGCGACVAACPNAAAMLFVGAKLSHLNLLPQGRPERDRRALSLVEAMDREGFGSCTNHLDCVASCPKEIPGSTMARLYRDFLRASLRRRR